MLRMSDRLKKNKSDTHFRLLGNTHFRKKVWYQLCTLYAVFVLEFEFIAMYLFLYASVDVLILQLVCFSASIFWLI